ncbi:hypothetical protein SARC_00550 [Sphaeroforma arctica JP610]|uniref:Mediator of RNA polymerase II transcription subunit 6 n=1 Tax=Sphaeroforma arctica JP610 TaxID=667725 RepID=A0A0L0GG85_9EUKA|nr:hypothetical protein SARC_00550 [Sphaeroforma arctica JP610]KNC87308.1 hypothetical protein SARC_00550 [Sphaeroforma arctica JP610]|eukprot:XP_014161210.1 hypothetical protein SARC_00550 [Sphaeroforma arctica JP610]
MVGCVWYAPSNFSLLTRCPTPQFPLDVNTVLTYFAKSIFYDGSCTNEQFRMQLNLMLLPFPSAQIVFDSVTVSEKFNVKTFLTTEGLEYDVEQKAPNLYLIRKQKRAVRPNGTTEAQALSLYYCIEGNIYPAPALNSVLNCRLLTIQYHLHEALSDSQQLRRFHPSAGYTWAEEVGDDDDDDDMALPLEHVDDEGAITDAAATSATDISETKDADDDEDKGSDARQQRSAQQASLDHHVGRLFQAIRQHYPLESPKE